MENLTLTPPVRVEAFLRKADTDNFKFYFTPGHYTISTYAPCSYGCTASQDTTLALLYGDRTVFATADDSGPLPPCEELKVLINDEGLYFVSVSSFNSYKQIGRYGVLVKPTIEMDFHPMCTDQIKNHKWGPAVEPNSGKWTTICYPVSDHGTYDSAIHLQQVPFYMTKGTLDSLSRDYFLFEVAETSTYVFSTYSSSFDKIEEETICWEYDCAIDTIMELRDRYGTTLARNDDKFRSCSEIRKVLEPGYYFLVIGAFSSTSKAGQYSLVGVKQADVAESVTWCPPGTTAKVCPATSNSIHSIHPVWIALFVALCVFVVATIAIGLSTHCGRTFYRPVAMLRADPGEGDRGDRDNSQVELDEFASS